MAVLRLLDDWPWTQGQVIIGGYAVAAYGRPRYSNDIDVVVPLHSTSSILQWLSDNDLVMESHSTPNPQNYDGEVFRYKKEDVIIDILSGFVRDRDAQVDVPQQWIAERPKFTRLFTLTGSTSTTVPVARAEAIWALKLQAGRDQDFTDLYSILHVTVNEKEVRDLFKTHWSSSLESKLIKSVKISSDRKIYEDSMSRLELKQTEHTWNDWIRFQKRIKSMIPM